MNGLTITKNNPEYNCLLLYVEKKAGRKLLTSSDYEYLSIEIEAHIKEHVSTSTIKRLWGYVSSNPVPRIHTLDILAKYAGFFDFHEFCKYLSQTSEIESSFFKKKSIITSSLNKGQKISISWNPNRIVSLKYLGENRYKVIESINSKLEVGDEFESTGFMLGSPLFISSVHRKGEDKGSYVAGSKEGLTGLELL